MTGIPPLAAISGRIEPFPHVIVIPDWHPTPLNKLMGHWSHSAKLKKRDREIVWAYSRKAKIPTHPLPKRSVEITIILETKQRACDPDAYFKSCLDALVNAGVLFNDSHVWCELLPLRYERAEQKATRIVLRDLA